MPNTEYKEYKEVTQNHYSDEITFKELILGIAEFIREIFRRWWVIPICCILCSIYFFRNYFNHTPLYNANLSFMLDDDPNGGGSGLGGLNDIIGELGGGNSSNLLKIAELFNSRMVIDNALLTSTTIRNKKDQLINHFIDEYNGEELIANFNKDLLINFKDIQNFRFANNKAENLTEEELIMLKVVYYHIVGHKQIREIPVVLETELDEDSGIVTMTTISQNEDLTLKLSEVIYKSLSDFFINKSVEKQQKIFDLLEYKKDSVATALKLAEFKLADFGDKHRNLVSYKGLLQEMKLKREQSILSIMYSTIVKNCENADFALRSKTPNIQVIDKPFRPLSPSRIYFPITLVKTIIVGTLLGIIVITFNKVIRDALES